MYTDEGRIPRSRRRVHHRPYTPTNEETALGERFSPDSYLQQMALRQSQRQRVRSRKFRGSQSRRNQSPVLSLAERIMISRLHPENLSMETTSSQHVQRAVAMTPRPTLEELIKQYRSMESEELELEHSVMEDMKDTHDRLQSVNESIHSRGAELNSPTNQSASRRAHKTFSPSQSASLKAEHSHVLNQSASPQAEQKQAINQSSSMIEKYQLTPNSPSQPNNRSKETGMDQGIDQPASQEAEPRTAARPMESKATDQSPRTDQSVLHSLKQSDAAYQSQSTILHEPNHGSRRQTTPETLQGETSSTTEVCTKASPVFLKPRNPGEDVTDEDRTKTNSCQDSAHPLEKVAQSQITKDLRSPSSIVQDRLQNGEHVQTLSQSSHRNKNNPLSEEIQAEEQEAGLAHSENSERQLAGKRTAYLQTHSWKPSEQKTTHEPDHERCELGERRVGNSDKQSNKSADAEANDNKEMLASPQAKLQRRDGKNSEENDSVVAVGSSHITSLPAIQGTILHDPASNANLHTDSAAAPFSLPSIHHQAVHSEHINNDWTESGKTADYKRLDTQPPPTRESVRLTGSDNNGNDDIPSSQIQRLPRLTEGDTAGDHNASQETSHGHVTRKPTCAVDHPNEVATLSDKENGCGGDLSDPSPILTSRRQRASEEAAPNIENENTEEDKGRGGKDAVHTAGKSINIIIGTPLETPPSPPSHCFPDMDVNRLHAPDSTDPLTTSRTFSGEEVVTRNKETNEQMKASKNYSNEITIEISSHGDVQISTYSAENILSDSGNNHDPGKANSDKNTATKDLGNNKDTRRKNQRVPSNNQNKHNFKNVKITDTFHVRAHKLQKSVQQKSVQQKSVQHCNPGAGKNPVNDRGRMATHERENSTRNAHGVSEKRNVSEQRPTPRNQPEELPFDSTSFPRQLNDSQSETSRVLDPCGGQSTSHTFTSVTKLRFNTESDGNDIDDDDDDGDDDDDDNDADDRIYDFIGLYRRRSYTLPEIVTRKPVSPPGFKRMHRIDDHSSSAFGQKTKPFLPELGTSRATPAVSSLLKMSSPLRTRGRTADDSHPLLFKLPALMVDGDEVASSHLRRFGPPQGPGSVGQGHVKLPGVHQRSGFTTGRACGLKHVDDRQHRVLDLYQELKHINMHSARPTVLRLNLTKHHTSDLNVRIEWGRRRFPQGDNTLNINYHTRQKSRPELTDYDKQTRLQNHFRRHYSETFIYLDDDVFPQVELRHHGEGFCPDVQWFVRPGAATERCHVGFSRGAAMRDRKSQAWTKLRNKCMSRVHIMKSLEMDSFAHLPKLKLK